MLFLGCFKDVRRGWGGEEVVVLSSIEGFVVVLGGIDLMEKCDG